MLCERPEKRRLALEGIDRVAPLAFDRIKWSQEIQAEAFAARLKSIADYCACLNLQAYTSIRTDFAGCTIQGADRTEVDLRRAELSRANMAGMQLYNADLACTILFNARLEGARMREVCMVAALCQEAHFEGAFMSFADLQGANLIKAHFEGAILIDAHMEHARVWWTRLEGANLSGAYLDGATLTGAFLQGTMLHCSRFNFTSMDGTYLNCALVAASDFTLARHLTYNQLASAFGDAATKLPPDLEAQRPRLIAEAGWAEDEIPWSDLDQRWADWRTRRGF